MEVEPKKKYKIGHFFLWTVLLLVVVMFLGGGSILYGCDSSNLDRQPAQERNNMELAKGYSSHDVAIPIIDLKAPSKTETATFSLG